MSTDRSILVLGSGPGIGVGVASYFAEKGFSTIALLSRNASRLQEDAATVLKTAPSAEVKTYTADLADWAGLQSVLSNIEMENGVPEVVVYNASHLTTSKLGEYSEAEIEEDLRVCLVNQYFYGGMWRLTSYGTDIYRVSLHNSQLVPSKAGKSGRRL
jgi:short-subunit dehydrogenase